MTPSGTKIHAPFVFSLALLAAACGPTRPPPELLGTAQQRLAEARNAGAATFAPLELRFAEERLDQARAAMQIGDYAATASLADESEANSALAGIKARLGKLRESVDTLRRDNSEIRRVIGPDADLDGVAR